jgi:hypothetical protein
LLQVFGGFKKCYAVDVDLLNFQINLFCKYFGIFVLATALATFIKILGELFFQTSGHPALSDEQFFTDAKMKSGGKKKISILKWRLHLRFKGAILKLLWRFTAISSSLECHYREY